MLRFAAGLEGLDDNHAATATWAGMRGYVRLAGLCGFFLFRLRRGSRHGQQFAGPCNIGGTVAIGQQAVMPDAMEPPWQHMHEEAADELVCRQRHGLVAARTLDAVVLVFECDGSLVGLDQPVIGDGDAVGVARLLTDRIAESRVEPSTASAKVSQITFGVETTPIWRE